MDKQHEKRVTRTGRRPVDKNTPRFIQSNTPKISNWKTPSYDSIILKNSPPSMTDLLSK